MGIRGILGGYHLPRATVGRGSLTCEGATMISWTNAGGHGLVGGGGGISVTLEKSTMFKIGNTSSFMVEIARCAMLVFFGRGGYSI